MKKLKIQIQIEDSRSHYHLSFLRSSSVVYEYRETKLDIFDGEVAMVGGGSLNPVDILSHKYATLIS